MGGIGWMGCDEVDIIPYTPLPVSHSSIVVNAGLVLGSSQLYLALLEVWSDHI
jgi:hypothetical protein